MIKILRDICLEQPTFSKITEMCVKMIRRVNDEEGIKVWICLQMVVKTWLPFFIEFFVDIYYFIFFLLHFLFIETGE